MKLFYSKGSCSLVVRIVISELNLDCDYESVDLKAKKTESGKNFLSINQKGSVPTIQLDNGEILTENTVILQYLADTAHADNLLPPVGEMKRYRVLEWLNFITTELHKGLSPLFNPQYPQQVKDDIIIPAIKKKFEFIDGHLQNHTYLLGKDFSLPDAYLFVILRWAKSFKLDIDQYENLAKFFTTMNGRDSVQQSLEQEK